MRKETKEWKIFTMRPPVIYDSLTDEEIADDRAWGEFAAMHLSDDDWGERGSTE